MSESNIQKSTTGLVETEYNRYVVSKKEIAELKDILDRLKIHYILDRVSYHSTESSLALAKAVHEQGTWKVEKDGSLHLDNQFGHCGKPSHTHLVISASALSAYVQDSELNILTSYEKLFLRRFR